MRPFPRMCSKGLHKLIDTSDVYVQTLRGRSGKLYQAGSCRECRKAARWALRHNPPRPRRLEWDGPLRRTDSQRRDHRYNVGLTKRLRGPHRIQPFPTEVQLEALQLMALGYSPEEAARQMCKQPNTVARMLLVVYRKYGVNSAPEAVLQGLKRGAITADRSGPHPDLWRTETQKTIRSLRALAAGQRAAYRTRDVRAVAIGDAMLAWSEAHAASKAWALGWVTSAHVRQTRYQYRPRRGRQADSGARA